MRRTLLALLCCLAAWTGSAQTPMHIFDGTPADSVVFDFAPGMPLVGSARYRLDTTGRGIWQWAATSKSPFGTAGAPVRGLVTDSSLPYPVRAGGAVILALRPMRYNTIVTFRHRYETAPGRDGGIVELSNDTGRTWHDVYSACQDSGTSYSVDGLALDSFYRITDTLKDGTAAFSGTSGGWRTSRIQLGVAIPIKATVNRCNFLRDSMLIRFRFQSDSIPESLAGWMISRIVVENDLYWGGIDAAGVPELTVFPNPTHDGHVTLPARRDAARLRLRVLDGLGRERLQLPYRTQLDLGALPKGLYWLQADGPAGRSTAKLLLD